MEIEETLYGIKIGRGFMDAVGWIVHDKERAVKFPSAEDANMYADRVAEGFDFEIVPLE